MSDCYVRHISGQGKSYKVIPDTLNNFWIVGAHPILYLPKDEYVVCEPPEQWEDVTSLCEVDGVRIYMPGLHHNDYIDANPYITGVKYRLRKADCLRDTAYFVVDRLRQL